MSLFPARLYLWKPQEAWLVRLPLQSISVVALLGSLGLSQPGATSMLISLGSLHPNPAACEGRLLARFSGAHAFSYLEFRWSETSFRVISVNGEIFLPATHLLGVQPLETPGFL